MFIPPVTPDEVLSAVERIDNNKTPGLDGIPNRVLKVAMKNHTDLFCCLYTTCFNEGVFPNSWKRQRLVLIPKGNKPPEHPSSYRPLCMLDTIGKIFERIISNRIEHHSDEVGAISNQQYGFRKRRSTTDAISAVCNIGREAMRGKRWLGGTKKYCAVITLDVKNAFNSANWAIITNILRDIETPKYLLNIINSYFTDRVLLYDTSDGPKKYTVTSGVPQGSVLGPLLWNLMYDGILRVRRPPGVSIIGYADDIAVTVVAKTTDEIISRSEEIISIAKNWLESVGLQLAEHKTEAVLLSSRKKVETITIKIGDHFITSKPNIKYLGVTLDHRLNFRDHLTNAANKAKKVGVHLARLMPNIGGPRQRSRRLIASVCNSIMLYVAPIWHQAFNCVSYIGECKSAYRISSLRVCSAYRTVSYDASSGNDLQMA